MKKLITQSPKTVLLLIMMLVFVQATAQKRYAPVAVSDMQYTIENDVQVSPNEMTFELWIKDNDPATSFELSIIQAGVRVSNSIIGDGTITVSLVPLSSQLVTLQQPTGALWETDANNGTIKLTPKAGPGCGSGTIIATTGLGTRVIGIKITNSVPFPENSHANLTFNFTKSPYPTKVFQYSGTPSASNMLVAHATNCFQGSTYRNIALNPTYAVTGGGYYCEGGAGLPVGVANSQAGVTYWLYANGVITTQFIPGTGGAISFGLEPGSFAGITYTVKGVVNPVYSQWMNGNAVNYTIILAQTWSGLVSNDWNTPGNWIGGNVPSAADDVIIPAGCPTYPALLAGSSTYCQNLEVAGSGIKSASFPGGLSISGELEVGGNMIIPTSGSLDITAGGALTVRGDLTISGILLVKSQGSLLTNGAVTGTAIIQRRIVTDLGWHFFSSPVDYQEICNGEFAPIDDNSFPGNIETWDFYKWLPNCPIPPDKPWINLRTSAGNVNYAEFGTPPLFEVTKGYLVAYGDGFQTTKSFVGCPNTGDKTCTFFDIVTACDFALAGNPFPSAIDWNSIDKTNLVNNYYYVWNENKTGGAGYEYYGGLLFHSPGVNGRIPSMQGFFVCVRLDGGKTLELPNAVRTHDVLGDYWLKETPANKLSITLGNGTNYDEAVVMFENNCSVGKDRNDAEKLFSMRPGIPQVYTIVDNDLKACLNAMPYVTNETAIPVGFVAPVHGNYSIKVTGIESFSPMTGLSLEDLKLNITQNLRQNPVYNFTATGNEDAGRFLLHFAGPIGIGEKDNSAVNIYSNEKTVFITCAAGFRNAEVTISSLLGQKILTRKLNDQTSNQVNVNALKGYYIVKVQTESYVKTANVFIN